ncbi:class A beta-lactamase [Spirosoma pollinicola]|uniref:Beta-lactamase n=1 Tax=Spirosoma pollinicola TaxID=2057025 RepID=A0A2K8YX01_9BACT|nr:class A beta-lactamase [Spirosoma pollinicola]AUD02157.1 serine hydrolase [Spirosoma pollinicola]
MLVNQSPASSQSVAIGGDLQKQIATIAKSIPGRVGVAASVVETGEVVQWQGNAEFPMQSVYKLPIAMAVLNQVDEGRLKFDQRVNVEKVNYIAKPQHSPIRDEYQDGTVISISELLRYAVSESDGSASDIVMAQAGGPAVVMSYLNSIGVRDIKVADTERTLGLDATSQYRNWAKPVEAVKLLGLLQQGVGLSASSRSYLLRLMTETETGLNRLKGQLPQGVKVAHKTGTSQTTNGVTAATNDIGLITVDEHKHIALAVFIKDSAASTKEREAVIAQVAKLVYDRWK